VGETRPAAADAAARLRRAAAPDARGAEERARRVVLAAADQATPPATRRRTGPRGAAAVAVALAAALGLVLAVTPPGDAVARWVKDLVGAGPPRSSPPPRPALDRLPAAGRLLVTGPGGAWVVHADGARRRLGPYRDAAWSPGGRFVAVTRDRTLLAVEPGGRVRWALARAGALRDPRWSSSGFRIAYRAGATMRVVAGDGTGDHRLVPGVAPVPAAWRPGPATNQVAVARRGGVVELWAADTPTRLWVLRAPRALALGWTPGGRRLVVVRRGGVMSFDARGRREHAWRIPGVTGGALAPDGGRVALLRGRRLELLDVRTGARRTAYGAPEPLRSATWSPDGRVLLVAAPRSDQWLFLPVARGGRLVAHSGIARQFDPARGAPRGAPAVAAWGP
jgi:hypothetical protein